MQRKKFVIAVGIIISVCSIINFSAIYKDYQREKREQQEKIEALHQIELKQITYVTSGKVELKDEISPKFDTRYVIMQVALYNECIDRGVEKGEKIAGYTEVQAEFDDYMSGKKNWEECTAINALYDFEKAEMCYIDNPEQEVWYCYNDYVTYVGIELKEITGSEEYNFSSCTNSEVEAASEIAAKKWCDYMEGK